MGKNGKKQKRYLFSSLTWLSSTIVRPYHMVENQQFLLTMLFRLEKVPGVPRIWELSLGTFGSDRANIVTVEFRIQDNLEDRCWARSKGWGCEFRKIVVEMWWNAPAIAVVCYNMCRCNIIWCIAKHEGVICTLRNIFDIMLLVTHDDTHACRVYHLPRCEVLVCFYHALYLWKHIGMFHFFLNFHPHLAPGNQSFEITMGVKNKVVTLL